MAYKQYKYKEYFRISLYLVSAILIGYFIYDSYNLSYDLTKRELLNNELTNKEIVVYLGNYYTREEVDLNITTGGEIWAIFRNIIQINFLIMFMLILYVNELIEKWSSKQ